MKFEYGYRIGPEGIEFMLLDGLDDALGLEGSAADKMTIQKYILLAWQEAVNRTSSGPEEIRRLMASEEGQALLHRRAEGYLNTLLDAIPPELDRRLEPERRKAARPGGPERRRRKSRVPER